MIFFKLILFTLTLLIFERGYTQTSKTGDTDSINILEGIDKAQGAILEKLSVKDSINNFEENDQLKAALSYWVINKIDEIQGDIQNRLFPGSIQKDIFLSGLYQLLNDFEVAYHAKELKPAQFPDLIAAYEHALKLEMKAASILPIIKESNASVCKIIVTNISFKNNPGIKESKEVWILKEYQQYPKNIMPLLFNNPQVSFADSLLKIIAHHEPEDIYTFSQAKKSDLGKRIHAINDTLVKLIAAIADRKDGRLLFPFLDDLLNGKTTMPQISKTLVSANKSAYFRLLVSTQVSYTERMQKGDTAIAASSLLDKLKNTAIDEFVNVINGLHEQPDNIRLKLIEPLRAKELYYLCVMGADELYTSSYLKIYQRIFENPAFKNGFALLQNLHFDYFKRFIKIAGNFNTLPHFLKTMPAKDADFLMRSFINGLENKAALEDAVDVADSYASIKDLHIRRLINEEVQKNIVKLTQQENKTGLIIYGLLNKIFSSMDSLGKNDMSASLGIPPVYQLNNVTLQNKAGKIIIQQFFYGDEDGNVEFSNFIKAYSNNNWKIITTKNWIEVHSATQPGIIIYANKPLDEITYLDIKAQEALGKYLSSNSLRPAVVIHRGHSYFVKYTIKQLGPAVKLVVLGSCGGYNNLKQIIQASPYVHIIATKQEGSRSVNQPIIVYLTELLRKGRNLNWPVIWKELDIKFKGNKKFEDYIPPYQNLGAIFMMAYYRLMDVKN